MLHSAKVFRDPVHNMISIDREDRDLIVGLIDTPEFQRLRRVRQLGVSFLTYPGAEHTRYSHSLGVYFTAKRMLDTLRGLYGRNSKSYRELRDLRQPILVAALLHDIGHGPFSHVFERCLGTAGKSVKHEVWSQRIIKGRLAPLLRRHGVDVEVVCGLIDEKSRKNLLAKDLISSQLDCDRVDYLLRDSMMAGAKYGLFDLDWLIHSLRVAEILIGGVPQRHLCFDSAKSMRLIESYILARESMYSQVYFHKTTRSFEALLSNIFGLACRITDGDPGQAPKCCPPILAKALAGVQLELEEYLKLDDSRIWTAFQDWGRGTCRGAMMTELARKCRVLTERQRPYAVVNLISDKNEKAIKLLAEFEAERAWGPEFGCLRDRFRDEPYKNVFYRKKASDDEEKEYSPIYVLDEGGRPQEAEQVSKIVRAISETQMEILRLHYDRENGKLMDRLRKAV